MLDQTFELFRLALNNAVLLNGAAAFTLLPFLGLAARLTRGPLTTAVVWFGCGAGLGGLASVLAYLGQRCNWEYSKNECARNWQLAADWLLWPAIQQVAIDPRMNAPRQHRFVLSGGTYDDRAPRPIRHDDQMMVV